LGCLQLIRATSQLYTLAGVAVDGGVSRSYWRSSCPQWTFVAARAARNSPASRSARVDGPCAVPRCCCRHGPDRGGPGRSRRPARPRSPSPTTTTGSCGPVRVVPSASPARRPGGGWCVRSWWPPDAVGLSARPLGGGGALSPRRRKGDPARPERLTVVGSPSGLSRQRRAAPFTVSEAVRSPLGHPWAVSTADVVDAPEVPPGHRLVKPTLDVRP
jgi:hypothetical protein